MHTITSVQNETAKQWKKLLTAKGRKQANAYLIESWHLVEEALKTPHVKHCMMTQDMYQKYGADMTVPIYIISDEIVQLLAQTQTPQPIFAVVHMVPPAIDFTKGKYMLIDAVQDPGNLGTIIRTADAAGFTGVLLGKGTVDVYNDKTIRSMQGSQFHLSIDKMDLLEAIPQFRSNHIPVYGTALNSKAIPLFSIPYTENCVLIVGNEGSGVSQDILQAADQTVFIPMPGKAESLNVAIAASLMMYHFVEK